MGSTPLRPAGGFFIKDKKCACGRRGGAEIIVLVARSGSRRAETAAYFETGACRWFGKNCGGGPRAVGPIAVFERGVVPVL